jgi:hypothetical protein
MPAIESRNSSVRFGMYVGRFDITHSGETLAFLI